MNLPIPALNWLRTHDKSWRRGDVLAGIALAACLLLLPARAALAQLRPGSLAVTASEPPKALGSAEATPQSVAARLAEAREELAAAEALGESLITNAPPGVSTQEVLTQRALRQRLVRLYEQQLSNVAELENTRTRRVALAEEAQRWTQFAEPPPYSVRLTDRLQEEIQVERLRIRNHDADRKLLDELLQENRSSLAQAEERVRQLNEQLEGRPDVEVAARWTWLRELDRLRSQVSAASLGVLESERRLREERLAASRVRLDLLQRQLIIANAGVKFTQTDLDQVLSILDRERAALEAELTAVLARQTSVAAALETARTEARTLPESGALDSASPGRGLQLVATREAQSEALDVAIRVLRLMLEAKNFERIMWQLRFAVHNSREASQLRESGRRLADVTRRLELWRRHELRQLEESASRIQLQESRLNQAAPDSELRLLLREQVAALRERDEYLLRALRSIERAERLNQRWAEGLRAAEARLPLTSRIGILFSDARSFMHRLWNFELFSAEDTITVDGQQITGKRSVTIGKGVTAVLILVVGYWITGWLARLMEPLAVRRFKVEPNLAKLISSWTRMVLVVCLILFSLVSVKIPLTVFAFAGGALAIALGFGMQTVLKNFVSGLILLFERPLRVGDVLDVGGQRGRVTSIGLRASVLQLWDGTETLIPNSSLLENNVTNWTYSNCKVRFTVRVGVAYGSDTRRVIQLLEGVAERHGLVEKDPKPQVLFTEFADSTLNFEVRYWVDFSRAVPAQVESDLRLMIDGAFAENGIVIAFPQRDLHLHARRPIPVEMVNPAAWPTNPTTQPTNAESVGHSSAEAESPQAGNSKVIP